MKLAVFIVILINAFFISIFLDIDFITSFFASPFISLLIFPITGLEFLIIYLLLELPQELLENKS